MMKKFLFIFVIIFSFALTGCAEDPNVTRFDTTGNSEQPESTESPSEEVATTETPEDTPEATNEVTQPQEVATEPESQESEKVEGTPSESTENSNEKNETQEETTETKPEEAQKPEITPEETDAVPVIVEEVPQEVAESEEMETPQIAQEKPAPEEVSSKSDDLKVSSFPGNHFDTKMRYNLIRGTAPENTYSLTINDFKLQKYYPGETAWSYIAATNFKTLKKGDNNYVVKALDKDGKEIDSFNFTINYEDIDSHALPNVGPNLWLTTILALSLLGIFKVVRKFKWQ